MSIDNSSSNDEGYSEHIVDHYEDPYHQGVCDNATHAHEAAYEKCGDRIRIELRIDSNEEIVEGWFEGLGCCLSLAAASVLMENIEGHSIEEVNALSEDDMCDLLGVTLPLDRNEGDRNEVDRRECCLLPLRVLKTALETPLDEDEDGDGRSIGGPHLGEET